MENTKGHWGTHEDMGGLVGFWTMLSFLTVLVMEQHGGGGGEVKQFRDNPRFIRDIGSSDTGPCLHSVYPAGVHKCAWDGDIQCVSWDALLY